MIVLSELLGESPFKILKKHSEKVHECIKLLQELFECVGSGNTERQKQISEQIFKLETEADKLRNYINEQLSKTAIIPMRKDDMLNILENQDSLADCAEEIAAVLSYRDMQLPDLLMHEIKKYLEKVLNNCILAEGIMSKLDLLEESSFGGRDALSVSKLITELNEREDEIKPYQIELTRKILNANPPINPIEAILWVQVIALLASLSKHAERIGNHLRPSLNLKQ